MDYSPWKITRVLYNKRGTAIFETTDSRWVLKDIQDDKRSAYELQMVLRVRESPPRYSIEFPPRVYGLYGQTPISGWYAMKRYDGCVERNIFCKERWRTVAIHVLQFLCDFHHTFGLVHMDIKKGNILVDELKSELVVADYEHADELGTALTSSYDDDHTWYYISMGAEMDQPTKAWRFDLAALGFVLGSLTTSPENWTFEKRCWEKRESGEGPSYEELMALRTAELATVDPAVRRYMERITEIPWIAKEPPTREFYGELEALFATQ